MRNRVHGVGEAGIIRDVKPQLLPHNVWSDGRNVRFEATRVYRMGGVASGLPATVTGLLSAGIVNSSTDDYIIYSTGSSLFAYDGTVTNDITRLSGGYGETSNNLFHYQTFNGFGLFNNGVDIPQVWDPTGGNLPTVDLANWDTTWRCSRMRAFKSFLIALGVTEGSTFYPHKMRWSSPAVPGAVPSSWDETDPTQEAGEFDFPDTDFGRLVDGLELGNRFMVYKEGSIWAFDYVGGSQILSRNLVVRNIGIKVDRSLVEIPNYKGSQPVHFFAGDDNFYIMDGTRPIPVFESVFKNDILKTADPTNYFTRSFSVVNAKDNEVWFCVPEVGEDYPTLAYCLNYVNGTYGIRELSGASTIATGIGFAYTPAMTEQDIPFADGTFFSDGEGFADVKEANTVSVLLEASPSNEDVFYLEVGTLDYDGVNDMVAYVQRESLATIQSDPRRPDTLTTDYNVRKLLKGFVPKLAQGSSAQVYAGKQERDIDPITWLSPIVVGGNVFEQFLPEPLSGRFLSFRWESVGNEEFDLSGFDYDVEILGRY